MSEVEQDVDGAGTAEMDAVSEAADRAIVEEAAGDAVGEVTATDVQDAGIQVPDPHTLLPEGERRFLAKRPQIEAAYKNLLEADADLGEANILLEDAKKSVKGKEAAREAAQMALKAAVGNDPAPVQMPLFGEGNGSSHESAATPADDAEYAEKHAAWEAKWDEFLAQPLAVLGLSETLNEKIAKHGDGIKTLKQLTKLKAESEGHGYTVIDGIGKGNADKIDDAYDKLVAEFLKANPQPAKAAAASTEPTPIDPNANIEFDFISTFPTPINPTEHEEYAESYHLQCRDESVAELTELHRLKELLSREIGENGKPLTERTKKTMETTIGELQVQHDDGFDVYAATFGRRASDALRRHVESAVSKKSNLKGGLE